MTNKIKVEMSNCFGIGELNHEFDFSNTNTNIVYAPNGVMKTSFTKSCKLYSENKQPKDEMYPNRISKFILKYASGNALAKEEILVVESEDTGLDSSHRISQFLANKTLKERYDQILSEIDEKYQILLRALKKKSQSSDIESELRFAFVNDENISVMRRIYEMYSDVSNSSHIDYGFKFNDIFDKKGSVAKFVAKNHSDLVRYADQYAKLLNNSTFFSGDPSVSFGTYQADQVAKAVGAGYFQAKHKLMLSDDKTQIEDSEALESLINEEINNVLEDPSLKEIFDRLDTGLNKNQEMRTFKEAIKANPTLIAKLAKYQEFRLEVLKSYLHNSIELYREFFECYDGHQNELKQILAQASQEVEAWKAILDIFNTRFNVPFTVVLKNQSDVLLKETSATLEFIFRDSDEEGVAQDKDKLLKVLSRGERRAFYILHVLFELEARKAQGGSSFIVFDDIADSFDYKNKYAIVEYLKELQQEANIKFVLLTHNFDFYRLVIGRFEFKGKSILMAHKNKESRKVTLSPGKFYREPIHEFVDSAENNPKKFVALIPFVRNIIEYTAGKTDEYNRLTHCLHDKETTADMTMKDIVDVFVATVPKFKNQFQDEKFLTQNYISTLYNLCEDIVAEGEENYSLANKLVLSMGIRLKSEEYMINKLDLSYDELKANKDSQTGYLLGELKKSSEVPAEELAVMSRTCLMTPENIHVNSFMYEPIIDMSNNHLISLYNDVKSLLAAQ